MLSLLVVSLLLLYLPLRVLRRFSAGFRASVLIIVLVKALFLVFLHTSTVNRTGLPIILDQSVDAKGYYDFGVAFEHYRLTDISFGDLATERGATSHIGYYYINVLAFHACPYDPMLFLRLCKLLLFHVGLGMLAETWRRRSGEGRAIAAYLLLGVVFYQFIYYQFRNLKDDVLLSLFMMLAAVVDRRLVAADERVAK